MAKRFTYKGRYIPENPKKYKGDPTNIIYRSSWEKQMMIYFDNNEHIVEWQSAVSYTHLTLPTNREV